jgi:hypothetical protein
MIDIGGLLSDNQDLTGQGVGSVYSANFIVKPATGTYANAGGEKAVPNDIGRANDADLFAEVTTAFTSQNSTATVQFSLVEADDENQTNVKVIRQTPAYVVTQLVAGFKIPLGPKLPAGMTKNAFGLKYTVGVEALTAGAVHGSYGMHADNVLANDAGL